MNSSNSIAKYHYDPSVKKVVVSIDVKATGPDSIVAIGVCAGTPDGRIVMKRRIGIRLRSPSEIKRMNAGRLDWLTIWKKKGYDLATYERFWKTRIDKLNMLQNDSYITLVNTHEELADEMNFILKEIEEMCVDVDIVTNTTSFDTVLVSRILADNYLQPLYYSRDGRYRWTYHTKSYYIGLWGGSIVNMTTEAHWAALECWLERVVDPIVPSDTVHSRFDPETDAFFMLRRYLNANILAEERMKIAMREYEEYLLSKNGSSSSE